MFSITQEATTISQDISNFFSYLIIITTSSINRPNIINAKLISWIFKNSILRLAKLSVIENLVFFNLFLFMKTFLLVL